MRVLHIAQSPHAAQPGAPQMPQQRMVNLSAYGRPGGELPSLRIPESFTYTLDSSALTCI